MEWNPSAKSTPKSLNLSTIGTRSPILSRRSLLTTVRKPSSRSSVSSRATQSRKLIAVTPRHVVESCGVSLPVLVAEALGYADRSAIGSVRISPNGWAWLVTGRRLFVWQYRQLSVSTQEGSRRWAGTAGQCRELNLPPSDLSHKADLVCIITNEGNHFPCCVAVTPEGTVRYWPSIAHEGSSVEDNADLQGQECDSLTYMGPHGCLLATTTSTIVLVVPQVIEGRHSIFCRMLKTPQGWLGGISRRVSSLIFGSITASQVMEVRMSRVIAVSPSDSGGSIEDAWKVYLLTGHSLQQWLIGDSEHLVAEHDLDRITRDAFQQTVWGGEPGLSGDSKVWLMDMQLIEGGFVVLAAAINPACSSLMYYAFGTMFSEDVSQPVKFSSFCPIKHTSLYREDEELRTWSYHFILHGNNAIMFNHKNIISVPVSSTGEELDRIEFMTSDDRVLGGALCANVPLFFLKNHGLISILPFEGPLDAFNNSLLGDSNISDTSQAQLFSEGFNVSTAELEEMSVNKDSTSRLAAAFVNYVKKERTKCESLLQDLFPASVMGPRGTASAAPDVGGPIDQVVVAVSIDIIDDIPAGDPRWSDVKQSSGSIKATTSLQILNQLESKQKVLELFFEFLKTMHLWEKLSAIDVHGRMQSTCHVLVEHEEKLVAAISLKTLLSNHSGVLDSVIKRIQVERGKLAIGTLSHMDLFFREVSKVHEAIQLLSQYSDEIAQSSRSPDDIATAIAEANSVILAVLQQVVNFRKQNSNSRCLAISGVEYLPWTAAPGKGGLNDALVLQHSITLKNGARLASNPMLRNELYGQLVNLIDIILDGCKCHLESVEGSDKYAALLHQYEVKRSTYIKSLVDEKEFERAAVLAEKYCDFEMLVRICDMTGNDDRLGLYQEKFNEQGFSNFLYSWYIREQKQAELLEKFGRSVGPGRRGEGVLDGERTQVGSGSLRRHGNRQALTSFLGNHPSISWIQDVFAGEHEKASGTLQSLASHEKDSIAKKKYMLSMAKLALLASRDDSSREDSLDWLNSQISLIESQENLPESTVISYGYEPDKMPVLTPAEIIKLYIADECVEATECEFSKALDLLPMIEDVMERDDLWLTVWCKAITRDKWIDLDSCVPVETCQKKLFFKLVELALMMGRTPQEVLPPIDKIMEMEELGNLRQNRSFQYLLKVGYEHYLKL